MRSKPAGSGLSGSAVSMVPMVAAWQSRAPWRKRLRHGSFLAWQLTGIVLIGLSPWRRARFCVPPAVASARQG